MKALESGQPSNRSLAWVIPMTSAAPQIAMPTWARRKWSPMMRVRPMPANGAAKKSPKPMCFCSEVRVWMWIWSAGASSAVPVRTTPRVIRQARPADSAISSPASVRDRIA
jgi:hypothetical protein